MDREFQMADKMGKSASTSESNMWVTLDQLVPFDRNPRKTRNPRYEKIKTSIRNTGLKHKLRVTRRSPDDDYFMIKDGGNTRLEILWELWKETDDEQYYRIQVDFEPWEGEITALAGHMSENENRGDTLFIEKALAAADFRELFEGEDGIPITGRDLARRITEHGWSLDQSNLSRYEYAVTSLLPHIPTVLWKGGVGHHLIIELRKIENAYRKYWEFHDTNPEGFKNIWAEVLTEHDAEHLNTNDIRNSLDMRLSAELDINYSKIAVECDMLIRQKNVTLPIIEKSDRPEASFATPSTTTSGKVTQHGRITDKKQNLQDLPDTLESLPHLRQQCFDLAHKMATICSLEASIERIDKGIGFILNPPSRKLQAEHPESGLFLRLYRLIFVGLDSPAENREKIITDLARYFEGDELILADFNWVSLIIVPYEEISKNRPDLVGLRQAMRQLEDLCRKIAMIVQAAQ